MSAWIVKKGNTSVQEVLVRDKDGVIVDNLVAVTGVKFVVKEDKKSATEKILLETGSGIAVDTPSTGYVQITLSPTDTDLSPGEYYMGLQITWSSDLIYEVILKAGTPLVPTEIFRVTQDTVN